MEFSTFFTAIFNPPECENAPMCDFAHRGVRFCTYGSGLHAVLFQPPL